MSAPLPYRNARLTEVRLDEASIGCGTRDQEHERLIAIDDLVQDNVFAVIGHDGGPYSLHLALHDAKLALDVRDEDGSPVVVHILSLTPFRKLLKDYFLICETYYASIRSASPMQIEAIDASRRQLHDEGAAILHGRLSGKIALDHDTARRLFTLVTALHWKG